MARRRASRTLTDRARLADRTPALVVPRLVVHLRVNRSSMDRAMVLVRKPAPVVRLLVDRGSMDRAMVLARKPVPVVRLLVSRGSMDRVMVLAPVVRRCLEAAG